MNLNSHLTQRLQKLPPPLTRSLRIQRDLQVVMRDGVVLLADRWAPAYVEAGSASVTFHVEAASAPVRLARELRAQYYAQMCN